MSRTRKRLLFFTFLFLFVIGVAFLVIRIAQGYRPDLNTLKFRPSGLLVATSEPDNARLYIDDKFVSTTKTTLNLPPGEYEVEVKKDGFSTWSKTLPVKKELVTQVDARLFPTFPNLQSLTFTGASNPVTSPDGQKVVFAVDNASTEKNGLWVLDLADRPLGFNREPQQIVKSAPKGRDFANSTYVWSPDSLEILVTLKDRPGVRVGLTIEENFLLDPTQLNLDTNLIDVTSTLKAIYLRWEEEENLRKKAKISKLPKELLKALGNHTKDLIFSPDETKLLYTATASATIPEEIIPPLPAANPMPESRELESGKVYVYDLKEDRNFFILEEEKAFFPEKATEDSNSKRRLLNWFPTSRHLFYVQEGKITILEYDNTNWVDVYSGPFENSFAFPFPSGNRTLILTSLGQDIPPNLYAISLR